MTVATSPAPTFGDAIRPCLETAFRVAEQLTETSKQAEECLTEAAMLGSRVRPSIEPGANIGPWFLGLVLRSCGGRYRRWELPSSTVESRDESLPLYEATAHWHERDADPAHQLFSRLDAADVTAALRSLPWEQRKMAALYYVGQFSYADLAMTLNISREELRPRLHRARRALQQALCARAMAAGILPAA